MEFRYIARVICRRICLDGRAVGEIPVRGRGAYLDLGRITGNHRGWRHHPDRDRFFGDNDYSLGESSLAVDPHPLDDAGALGLRLWTAVAFSGPCASPAARSS